MSTATPLPAPDAAYSHLFNNVHAEVFFTKLAQAGYTPANEKEAQDLLELSGTLRGVAQAEKQAAETQSRFAHPRSRLEQILGNSNVYGGQHKQAQDREAALALSQAASFLMERPDIYNSVLSVKAAEAGQFN